MTIDADLVTRKMMLIVRDLDALVSIRGRGRSSYLGNTVDQAVAERHPERMVGRMIDISYHLLPLPSPPALR